MTLRLAALAAPLMLLACEVNVDKGDGDDTAAVGDDDDTAPTGDDDDDTTGDDDDDTAPGDDDDDDAVAHAADCAGLLSGSYEVDGYPISGAVEGELLADGTLYVTFTSSAGDTNAEGFVSAAGEMSGTHQGVTIDGTFDLAACTGDGTWIDLNQGGATGTYDVATE